MKHIAYGSIVRNRDGFGLPGRARAETEESKFSPRLPWPELALFVARSIVQALYDHVFDVCEASRRGAAHDINILLRQTALLCSLESDLQTRRVSEYGPGFDEVELVDKLGSGV